MLRLLLFFLCSNITEINKSSKNLAKPQICVTGKFDKNILSQVTVRNYEIYFTYFYKTLFKCPFRTFRMSTVHKRNILGAKNTNGGIKRYSCIKYNGNINDLNLQARLL